MAAPEQVMWEGRFITAKRRGTWEYVSRARGIKAAVIIAIDDGHVLLVEQFRVPLAKSCLELPAGLVGDDAEGEDVAIAAARELEEETGYRPARIDAIGEFYSSPGMVSESTHLVSAHGLTKTGDGGGVAGENIAVHRVPMARIAEFISARRASGVGIDVKLLMLVAGQMLA